MAGLTWLAGCESGADRSGSGDDRPLVVCTTTVIADMTRQIAADRARVVGIMPPGTDPHIYEPRPDDAVLLRKADLIVYNGLHLEGRMIQIFEGAGDRAVAVAEDERIKLRGSVKYEGAPDPHCWWNPKYFIYFVERTRDALCRIDPEGRREYEQAAAVYIERLERADTQVRAAVRLIPEQRRYLITSHDAFYYYGEAYGLTVDSVMSISTDAQVQALRINELAALVVKHEVPAIFHETSVSAALNEMVDRVMDLAAKRGHEVVIPEQALYSDSLAEPGTPAGTYLGALRENTRVIVSALAGEDVSDLLTFAEIPDDGS